MFLEDLIHFNHNTQLLKTVVHNHYNKNTWDKQNIKTFKAYSYLTSEAVMALVDIQHRCFKTLAPVCLTLFGCRCFMPLRRSQWENLCLPEATETNA